MQQIVFQSGGDLFNQSQFQNGKNEKFFSKAPALTTEEIKLIVDYLNRPPFMADLSLVEFDD